MPEFPRYETRQVLGDAYPQHVLTGPARILHTHTVRIEPGYAEGVPLCKRVKEINIADSCADPHGLHVPPTCPTCRRRDPRFKEAA